MHATERITAQYAVESGCDYLVHSIEDEVVTAAFIQMLKQKNVFLCPTLTVVDGYLKTFGQKREFTFHELTRSEQMSMGSLEDLKHLLDTALVNSYKKMGAASAYWSRLDSIRKVNLRLLAHAGVKIVTGTDAGNIGTLHATSYITELKEMKNAGMTNWQILEASTINGAAVLGREKVHGSIAQGKAANMILLDNDPVEDLMNVQQISLVILQGQVIVPDTLIKPTPESLVQQQLNAYNARNLDAFLEPYSDHVELFEFPSKPVGTGKEDMRKIYSKMFKQYPDLHCELKSRIIQGNTVIDHESVRMGNEKFNAIAIYHIELGKIRKVYFIQ